MHFKFSIFAFIYLFVNVRTSSFIEEVLVRPSAGGFVQTTFNFVATAKQESSHYEYIPKPIGEIIVQYQLEELHISLTQGLWKSNQWGLPSRSAPSGAEVLAWFDASKIAASDVDPVWNSLTNALAGLLCASFNFMDEKSAVSPHFSFRPAGAHAQKHLFKDWRFVRYSTLSRETVCTENLTPWRKLLPCGFGEKSGLASLLNSLRLYDAVYSSIGLDVQKHCFDNDCTVVGIKVVQTIDVVFNIGVERPGKTDFSLQHLFNRKLAGRCLMAEQSLIFVDMSPTNNYVASVLPQPNSVIERADSSRKFIVFDLRQMFDSGNSTEETDIVLRMNTVLSQPSNAQSSPFSVHRYSQGYGLQDGGIITVIRNHLSNSVQVILTDHVPWYFQLQLHTLEIVNSAGNSVGPLRILFEPGKSRTRSSLLEVAITIPPSDYCKVFIRYRKALLKWTEYPPDPNHGFYIPSGALIFSQAPLAFLHYPASRSNGSFLTLFDRQLPLDSYVVRLYTEALLISFPLPDFSMPYNVICLVCTVVALAFGSIHNVTTRDLVLVDPVSNTGILSKVKKTVSDIFKRTKSTPSSAAESVNSQNTAAESTSVSESRE